MGHKVHPKAFRIKTTTTWPSRWFARKADYRRLLKEDVEIQEFLRTKLYGSQVSDVKIERSRGSLTVTIVSGKPGFVIGRSGSGIEDLKKQISKTFFQGKNVQFQLNVVEPPKASLESAIIAEQIVSDLLRRMPYRRVLKSAIQRVQKAGALGVKVAVAGRLNGAEIARGQFLHWGKIPLTNLRADIDYARDTAKTPAGMIGVKVWIYRGDIFEKDKLSQYQPTTPMRRTRSAPRA